MSGQNGNTEEQKRGFSRRLFMKGMGTSVVSASAITTGIATSADKQAEAQESSEIAGPGLVPITLNINGQTHEVRAEPRETLLDVLRNRLDITGSKLVCGMGSCGACTVQIDGKAAYSCLMLAIQAQGKEIKTIEGLANGEELHPVQEAFLETDALQCGFCTPGFVMAMAALFDENPNANDEEVREGIAGNICRCGTYTQMFEAANMVRKRNGGQ